MRRLDASLRASAEVQRLSVISSEARELLSQEAREKSRFLVACRGQVPRNDSLLNFARARMFSSMRAGRRVPSESGDSAGRKFIGGVFPCPRDVKGGAAAAV